MAKEQTMEERIAEIVIRGFKHKQEDCETCKELWVCSTVVEKCTVERILALIAADRDNLYREGFKKGEQIGMATQALEDKKVMAGLVEALEATRIFITNQYWDGSDAHLQIINKIDSALKSLDK
jgi:hypothetical protein